MSNPTRAALPVCRPREQTCSWSAMFPCKIARAMLLANILGGFLCPYAAGAAEDQLKDLEQRLRQEMSQADPAQRTQVPLPAADTDEPGYFGIIADDRQTAGAGVKIVHLAANGPAARAGLQEGDLITAIDGHPLRQMRDLAQVMTGSPAGKRLHVAIERNQQPQEVFVTLDRRPPRSERLLPEFGRIPTAADSSDATGQPPATRLGLRIAPLTETARRQHNLPVVAGVLVTGVTVGSPAQRAGVPAGSVIVAIGQQAVRTTERFGQLIAAAVPTGVVPLTYYAHGKLTETRLRLDAAPQRVEEQQRPAPLPPPQAPASEDLVKRLDQLQRRVEQLERQVEQLEQRIDRLQRRP